MKAEHKQHILEWRSITQKIETSLTQSQQMPNTGDVISLVQTRKTVLLHVRREVTEQSPAEVVEGLKLLTMTEPGSSSVFPSKRLLAALDSKLTVAEQRATSSNDVDSWDCLTHFSSLAFGTAFSIFYHVFCSSLLVNATPIVDVTPYLPPADITTGCLVLMQKSLEICIACLQCPLVKYGNLAESLYGTVVGLWELLHGVYIMELEVKRPSRPAEFVPFTRAEDVMKLIHSGMNVCDLAMQDLQDPSYQRPLDKLTTIFRYLVNFSHDVDGFYPLLPSWIRDLAEHTLASMGTTLPSNSSKDDTRVEAVAMSRLAEMATNLPEKKDEAYKHCTDQEENVAAFLEAVLSIAEKYKIRFARKALKAGDWENNMNEIDVHNYWYMYELLLYATNLSMRYTVAGMQLFDETALEAYCLGSEAFIHVFRSMHTADAKKRASWIECAKCVVYPHFLCLKTLSLLPKSDMAEFKGSIPFSLYCQVLEATVRSFAAAGQQPQEEDVPPVFHEYIEFVLRVLSNVFIKSINSQQVESFMLFDESATAALSNVIDTQTKFAMTWAMAVKRWRQVLTVQDINFTRIGGLVFGATAETIRMFVGSWKAGTVQVTNSQLERLHTSAYYAYCTANEFSTSFDDLKHSCSTNPIAHQFASECSGPLQSCLCAYATLIFSIARVAQVLKYSNLQTYGDVFCRMQAQDIDFTYNFTPIVEDLDDAPVATMDAAAKEQWKCVMVALQPALPQFIKWMEHMGHDEQGEAMGLLVLQLLYKTGNAADGRPLGRLDLESFEAAVSGSSFLQPALAMLNATKDTVDRYCVKWKRQFETEAAKDPDKMARLAALHRRCAKPKCVNMSGFSERRLESKRCSACLVARFCSRKCQKAGWVDHKKVCGELKDSSP